jgi:N-acylglucosamine 2-epimerase
VHEYTFRVFPNPDQGIGEWIQIRDREGAPESKVVALPVKDPFHITRNLILIVDLLQGLGPSGREQALDESKER